MNNIPIRLDYYQYCVETWQYIFQQIDFSTINTIIDLCPGWAPKIEMALLKTNFKGTIYAIDENKDHLDTFHTLIDPFEKQFDIQLCNTSIDQIDKTTISVVDLIIGNHIIDDLLINQLSKSSNNSFTSVLTSPNNQVLVSQLITNHPFIINDVSYLLLNLVDTLLSKNGYLLLSQYTSYTDKLKNRSDITSQKIMFNLKKHFKKINYIDRSKTLFPTTEKQHYFTQKELLAFQK